MFGVLVNNLNNFRNWFLAIKARKETVNQLNKLTERELNDIGLSRSDIHYIAEQHYRDILLSNEMKDQRTVKDLNSNLNGWV